MREAVIGIIVWGVVNGGWSILISLRNAHVRHQRAREVIGRFPALPCAT